MDNQKLSKLMASYQAGQMSAFEELYQQLKPRLYRYLTMLTSNPAQAEDLLQETFLQIHRSRRTYLAKRPVTPWAFSIARHVYLMAVRKKSRVRKHEASADTLPEIPVPPEAEGLAGRAELQKALATLSPEQVEAVTLHHVWGFTFQEIAGTLGILPVTAKVRSFRGMKRLREALESGL